MWLHVIMDSDWSMLGNLSVPSLVPGLCLVPDSNPCVGDASGRLLANDRTSKGWVNRPDLCTLQGPPLSPPLVFDLSGLMSKKNFWSARQVLGTCVSRSWQQACHVLLTQVTNRWVFLLPLRRKLLIPAASESPHEIYQYDASHRELRRP